MALAAKAGFTTENLEKWRDNVNVGAFIGRLNTSSELRTAFRAAVDEAKGAQEEKSAEEQATAGLANLFTGV